MPQAHDDIFYPIVVGYNGAFGPVEATLILGLVQPPKQSAVSLSTPVSWLSCARNLISWSVANSSALQRTLEYRNPSFLFNKPSLMVQSYVSAK